MTKQTRRKFSAEFKVKIALELPDVIQNGTFRILSITGQEIHAFQLSGQQSINVDLSNHAAGIYLIDVRSDKVHYQKKLVKM